MGLKFINEDTGVVKPAVFCFTGKCPKPRSEMEAIAIQAGASVTKSITSRTTILVIADPNSVSSKAQNARIAGIHLISPEQFFNFCDGNTRIVSMSKTKHGRALDFDRQKAAPKSNKGTKKHSPTRRIEL